MITLQKNTLKPIRDINVLLLTFELLFLFILFKNTNFSVFFILLFFSFPLIYRFPEFGLAIAVTGRIILHVLFDYIIVGLPFPALVIYLIISIGGALLFVLQKPVLSSISIKAPQIITLLLFLLLLFGATFTTNPAYASQKLFFYFLFNILLVFLPLVFVNEIIRIGNIFIFAYFIGLLLGIVSTYLALHSPNYLRFQPSENVNPIWLSSSLGASLLASIYLLQKLKRRFPKILVVSTYPLFIYPMLRSWSRGPLLGLFLSLFLFYFLQPNTSKRQKIIAGSVVFIASIAFLFFTSNQIVARLRMPLSQEMSAAFRILAWIESLHLFKANPLFGIGTGSFFINFPFAPFIYPHNIFLEIACENGVAGLLLLFSFTFLTIKMAIRTIRFSSGKMAQLAIIALVLFFYALWNSLLSGDISTNENLWLTAGILTSLSISKRVSGKTLDST